MQAKVPTDIPASVLHKTTEVIDVQLGYVKQLGTYIKSSLNVCMYSHACIYCSVSVCVYVHFTRKCSTLEVTSALTIIWFEVTLPPNVHGFYVVAFLQSFYTHTLHTHLAGEAAPGPLPSTL